VCCLGFNVCVFNGSFFTEVSCLFYFIPVLLVNLYIQWKDEFMSELFTDYSEKENYEVVIKTLNNLNWVHFKKYDETKLNLKTISFF
jgi:hypothetical protein